jgi:hypothetical protein
LSCGLPARVPARACAIWNLTHGRHTYQELQKAIATAGTSRFTISGGDHSMPLGPSIIVGAPPA